MTDSKTNLITYFIDIFTVSDVKFIESGQVNVNDSHSSCFWTLPYSNLIL